MATFSRTITTLGVRKNTGLSLTTETSVDSPSYSYSTSTYPPTLSTDGTTTTTNFGNTSVAGTFTIEGWIKLASGDIGQIRTIYSAYLWGAIVIKADKKLYVMEDNSEKEVAASTILIDDTNWHYFAVTKSVGNATKIYIDGDDVTNSAGNASFSDTAYWDYVGLGWENHSTYANGLLSPGTGRISNLYVYLSELSATRILAHYNTGGRDYFALSDSRPRTDTGVTQTDSLNRRLARRLSDTAVTNTDSNDVYSRRGLTDTGLTQTDSLASVRRRTASDTGLTQTDSLRSLRLHNLSDTGVTNTDSTDVYVLHRITDSVLTQTDSLVFVRTKIAIISDTGVTQTDSLARTAYFTRTASDTGTSQTDNVRNYRYKTYSDTGVTQTDNVDAFILQIGRPVEDISTGNWYLTPLYTKLDDSASDDDGLYVYSGPASESADIAEVRLTSLTDPDRNDYHIIRYSIAKNATTANLQLTVRLMQDATEIASWAETLTTTTTVVERTLTSSEAANITDYTNLRIKLEAVTV